MVSIIVPVYNAENTIEKCVKSILSQQYPCKEIILINDGSQDKSLEIMCRLAEQHSEITVIDKPNGGVSSARNAGLEVCTGEYVTFIDSDDYYLSNTYIANMAKLLDDNENIGLVVVGYTLLTGQRIKSFAPQVGVKDIQDVAAQYLSYGVKNAMNSPWNKLFRARLIKNMFDEQMKMGEDAVFVLQYMKNCQQVAFGDDCGYGYVCVNSSTTAEFRKKQPYDMAQSRIYHQALYDFWSAFLPDEEVAQNYIRMRTDEVILMMQSLLYKKGIREFLKRDVAEVIRDERMIQYRVQIHALPKTFPHKKLAVFVAESNTMKTKAYCLWSIVKKRLKMENNLLIDTNI